jgi:hypothetical protein
MTGTASKRTAFSGDDQKSLKESSDGVNSDASSLTRQILNRSIEDQIRDRAYQLYLQRGQRDGNAQQDWLDAEFELLANR